MFEEVGGHLLLSELFAYAGNFIEAAKEIAIAEKIDEKYQKQDNKSVPLSLILRFRTNVQLLAGNAKLAERTARAALRSAYGSQKFETEIINAELYISKAILANLPKTGNQRSKMLNEAEIHLHKAAISCCSINLIEAEPNILLTWATIRNEEGDIEQAKIHIDEALYIASRCEYKLKQAEIHNFIAYMAKKEKDASTARKHATLALEIARCDGSSLFYKPAMDTAMEILKNL